MADLAKLVVRLEAQSAQLLQELDKANSRLRRFERDATGSLDKINRRFERFGFGAKTAIATFLGGLSFQAIIRANEEAAETFGLLENAVERAGDAAGGRSARDFANTAKAIANITTQTGGAVQGVQQLLLRFQNIRTDRFDEATRAVLDFATATRRDLSSAAEIVGKALANPEKGMTALAKAGVAFSESQQKVVKDLVESGRRAEAQGIILDKLADRFGGAAEKARNNFGGAMKAVRNALGDLMESEDGLPGATAALNDLAGVLQDPAVKVGADQLFTILITGAAKAAKFIGETAAGIAVLFNATGDRVEELEKQIRFLEEQRDSFLPAIANFGAQGDIFPEGGVDAIFGREDIQKKIDELKALQQAVFDTRAAAINAANDVRGANLKGAFELPDIEVTDDTEALEKLRKKLEEAGKALTEKVRTPQERFNDRVKEADRLLAANVITLETWVRAIAAAGDELAELQTRFLEVNERFKSLDDQVQESIDAANEDLLESTAEQHGDTLSKEFDDVLERSEKQWSVFADQAARNVQDIIADGLENGFDDGFEGVLESFGRMLQKMAIQAVAADIAGKLFGVDKNGNPGGGGGWIDKALQNWGGGGSVSGGGGGWWDAAANLFGQFLGSRDQGGRGSAGVPVMIGRGAQPEMFVPDSAGDFYPVQQWARGGSSVTQNIYTQGPLTQRSIRQLEVEASRRQRTATARLGG